MDRALSVLEILAAHGEAGVTEVATELGVHKSTAFRLVAVLESRGFVEQLADRGKYRLGFGVVRLAGAAAAQLDIAQQGRQICEALAADLEETVNIAILDGDRAVNVSQVRGPAALSTHNWVGQGTPLHATSSGKVLLAHAPDAVRKGLLSRELPRFTPATITDPEALQSTSTGSSSRAGVRRSRSTRWGSAPSPRPSGAPMETWSRPSACRVRPSAWARRTFRCSPGG